MACRLLLLLLVALACGPSLAAEPATPPFLLDIDAKGHRAIVRDLALSPDGQTLVSASDDKTIRVWDWQAGVSLRTLRGTIGLGAEGKVYAVAISPDETTVAAGGYFGPGLGATPPYGDIRLFDLRTGKMKAVLRGAEHEINDLAFSPDGQRLAAGGNDGFVFLWRRDDGVSEGWAPDTRLDADSWSVSRVAFLSGGTRLLAATADNGIRLWDVGDASEISPEDAENWRDIPVSATAVSADGALFALGGKDGTVEIRRSDDGALVVALPPQGFQVGALALTGDASRLIVACGYRCADKNRTTVWDAKTGAKLMDERGHDGTVTAGLGFGAGTGTGTMVATAGGLNHAIRIWDAATGKEAARLEGVGAPVMSVGLDPKAEALAWGTANPCPASVACPEQEGSITEKLLLPNAERFFDKPLLVMEGETFARAQHQAGGWSIHAEAGMAEEGDGEPPPHGVLAVSHDEAEAGKLAKDATNGQVHSAFTLVDKGARLITGGAGGMLLDYRTEDLKYLGDFVGHDGEIHALAASPRLNLLVSGSADQTMRLWNLTTRELIASMFFAGSEWIVWMPQGYYYSSDEGDKLIGWHVNQGQNKEGRFIRAGQLKRYLWSPEMVRRAIILRSAAQAVKEMRPGVDHELEKLLGRAAPDFELRLAPDQSKAREGYVALEVVGDAGGFDEAELSVLSNSRNVSGAATRAVGAPGGPTVIEVPVEAGQNNISVTATDSFGYLTERSVVALGSTRKDEPLKKKGKLFVVAIGVERYPFLPDACNGRSCDLRYPVADAAEFVRVMAERSAPLYSGMESLVLVNGETLDAKRTAALEKAVKRADVREPEADAIADEVADFLDKPGPDDTTFVFVAGHGINVDEDYYFIPTDGRMADGGERWKRSSLVDWADIQKAVERAEGTRVMLLDTCHAANAFNPRLEKDAADARVVVFSATAANNTAAELPELGHGVFTYSLLEGLGGKANSSGDGVRLLGLADYLYREVVRLTAEKQKPFYYISNMENILLAAP